MGERPKGYSYSVDLEQIHRYRAMEPALRLRWLFWGNKLRKNLPHATVAVQEAFRQCKR
jgi:hypothetical protein